MGLTQVPDGEKWGQEHLRSTGGGHKMQGKTWGSATGSIMNNPGHPMKASALYPKTRSSIYRALQTLLFILQVKQMHSLWRQEKQQQGLHQQRGPGIADKRAGHPVPKCCSKVDWCEITFSAGSWAAGKPQVLHP